VVYDKEASGRFIVADLALGTIWSSRDLNFDVNNPNTGRGDARDTLTSIENIIGTYRDDTIYGDGAANELSGSLGDDVIYGRDGDDVIIGGRGADTLDGGAGNDTVSYEDLYYAVELDLQAGIARTYLPPAAAVSGASASDLAGYETDTLSGFENATGSTDGDLIQGNSEANILRGNEGDDIIEGRRGNDVIEGGEGNDDLTGGEGDDTLSGGNGDDLYIYRVGDGADTITDTQGTSAIEFRTSSTGETITPDDVVFSEINGDLYIFVRNQPVDLRSLPSDRIVIKNYTQDKGTERDTLRVLQFENQIIVGDELEQFIAQNPANTATIIPDDENLIRGDNTDNSLYGNNNANTIFGYGGANIIGGGGGNDTISGGADRDKLFGGDGDDVIYGDEGNDDLSGDRGNDTLIGGAGDDVYFYGGRHGVDQIIDTQGSNSLYIFESEELPFVDLDKIRFYEVNGDLEIYLNIDLNNINISSTHVDRVNKLIIRDYTRLRQAGYSPITTLYVGGSNPLIRRFDDLVASQSLNQHLTGTANADDYSGSFGDDVLLGLGGNDNLLGREGNDVIDGGAGNDNLDGGEGYDTLRYGDTSTNQYRIYLQDQNTSAAGYQQRVEYRASTSGATWQASGDTISNFEAFAVNTGSTNSITVYGNELNNTFRGGDFVDTFFGYNGDDLFEGGDAADILNGGDGFDTTSYEHFGYAVDIDLRDTNTSLAGYQQTHRYYRSDLNIWIASDALTDFEAAIGSRYGDIFTGNQLNNAFYGLAGNDTFTGGGGNDTLNGGAGNDTYNYQNTTGVTTIVDSEGSNDTLVIGYNLSQLWFKEYDSYYEIQVGNGTNAIGSTSANRIKIEKDNAQATVIEAVRIQNKQFSFANIELLISAMAGQSTFNYNAVTSSGQTVQQVINNVLVAGTPV